MGRRKTKGGGPKGKPATKQAPSNGRADSAAAAAANVVEQIAEGTVPPASAMNNDQYLAIRRWIDDAEQKSSEQLDKYLLTLANAALGVTIVYRENIAPNAVLWTVLLLYLGWASLVGSIVALVHSLRCSQAGFRHQRKLLDAEIESGLCQDQTNAMAEKTEWLNVWALRLFVAGLAFLLLFSGVNLAIDSYRKSIDPQGGNLVTSDKSDKNPVRTEPHGTTKGGLGDTHAGQKPPTNPVIRERPATPPEKKDK